MRYALTITLVGGSLLAQGCTGNCASPQALNGVPFQVFAHQVERLSGEADFAAFTAPPAFLSYGSPANGSATWVLNWGAALAGPVTVTLDGQPFEGEGDWDPVECGMFALSFAGEYLAEDGTIHAFDASGTFLQFDDALRGELDWFEIFTATDGTTGRYRAAVAVEGSR